MGDRPGQNFHCRHIATAMNNEEKDGEKDGDAEFRELLAAADEADEKEARKPCSSST